MFSLRRSNTILAALEIRDLSGHDFMSFSYCLSNATEIRIYFILVLAPQPLQDIPCTVLCSVEISGAQQSRRPVVLKACRNPHPGHPPEIHLHEHVGYEEVDKILRSHEFGFPCISAHKLAAQFSIITPCFVRVCDLHNWVL